MIRNLRLSAAAALMLSMFGAASCNDSDETKGSPADASADAKPDGTTDSLDPFTGDCSAAKWASVSDECWSCLCESCADTLNLCEEGCIDLMQCALDQYTLVGDGAEIQCEIRATRAECLRDGSEVTWQQAADFDVCLISTPKESGFRVCEAECNITYSGDVCDRYPEPAADGG